MLNVKTMVLGAVVGFAGLFAMAPQANAAQVVVGPNGVYVGGRGFSIGIGGYGYPGYYNSGYYRYNPGYYNPGYRYHPPYPHFDRHNNHYHYHNPGYRYPSYPHYRYYR